MDTIRQIKRIITVVFLIVLGIIGYSYWERIEPIVSNISEKISTAKDLLETASDVQENIAGVDVKEVYITTDSDEYKLELEVADSNEERSIGLMYRENLCESCGMLFVYENDTNSGFWMKNCRVPLDIVFIDDEGKIIDIKSDFEICDENCPTYSPDEKYRYAIEVNGGWTTENDVNKGDTVVGIRSDS